MSEIIKKVEAVLFAIGRAASEQEISELTKEDKQEVHRALIELKKQYAERESPLLLIEEGDAWKLTVHEKYLHVVHQISPHTELSKSILETLAVIAWKQPATQSDVIKIRTNKAYEHIDELEKMGYISRQKHGRTFLLKVTHKFLDYFDLRGGDAAVKQLFKDIKDVGEAQAKLVDHESKEVGLEVYGEKETDNIDPKKEMIGELEVFEDVETENESSFEETKEENPVKEFIKEVKKPAPQEIEEGLAEENEESEEITEVDSEEKKETKEEDSERELEPELEKMVQDDESK